MVIAIWQQQPETPRAWYCQPQLATLVPLAAVLQCVEASGNRASALSPTSSWRLEASTGAMIVSGFAFT